MSSPSEGCLQLPHGQVLVQVWADVASCPSPAAAAAAELYICRGQASSCEGGLAGACRAEDGIGEAAGRGHGRVPLHHVHLWGPHEGRGHGSGHVWEAAACSG